ncbi:ankyrin, partial [Thozetella sp. PMI_491]
KGLQGAVESVDKLLTQNEEWRNDQTERHRAAMRFQLNTLIGKFNTTAYKSHMKRNEFRIEGTCQWFCHHDKFQNWTLPNSDPLLVISADPGCGKSTLAQYLISSVLPEHWPNATICYYFFKANPEQQSVANGLCAILHRLFDDLPERAQACEEKIIRYGDKLFSDAELLWDIFETAVSQDNEDEDDRTIICVLDALDECDPSSLRRLLGQIDALYSSDALVRRRHIRFLMTTRGYPRILQQIRTMESPILQLAGEGKREMDDIQSEISLVVEHRLKALVRMKNLDEGSERVIRESISEKASSQRTYLWVKLVFEVLEANFDDDPEKWERLIANPPGTITEVYEELLGQVKKEDQTFVRTLVHLVFISERPLTLREMNIAIEAREYIDEPDIPRLRSDESFRIRVIDACGFFITSYDSRLFFIHQTAQEFLDPYSTDPVPGGWAGSVSQQTAHRTMAESCIAYLSLHHVRDLNLNDFPHLRQWLGEFLYLACHTDSPNIGVISMLLNKGADPNFHCNFPQYRHGACSTPLRAAIASYSPLADQKEIVKRLVDSGADARDQSMSGATPLHDLAVKNRLGTLGEGELIDLLLDAGADINAKDHAGQTPLLSMCRDSFESVRGGLDDGISSLVQNGADFAVDNKGYGALHWLALRSMDSAVAMVLGYGINVDLKTDVGHTPLHLACMTFMHREEVLTILVNNFGADVNAQDHEGCTALHWASLTGDLVSVETLLDEAGDLDIGIKNNFGHTALHLPCSDFSSGFAGLDEEVSHLRRGIVGRLLDRGLDPDVKDEQGLTALDWTKQHEPNDIGMFLQARLSSGQISGYNVASQLERDVCWTPPEAAELPAPLSLLLAPESTQEPEH